MPNWLVFPSRQHASAEKQNGLLRIRQTLGRIAVLAVLSVVWIAISADAGEIDQATKDYLEGIWLIGKQPDKGPCIANWYDGTTQWEFEFRKTGGRLMIYEPADLFTPIAISRIEQNDNRLAIWGQRRDGQPALLQQFRLLPPNQLELLVLDGNSKDPVQTPGVAYRCGGPGLSVNDSVSMADLSLLTPNLTLSRGFPAAEPGISDKDLCNGKTTDPLKRSHWLQFELLGPVHYWVLGMGFNREERAKHNLQLDLVRKIRRVDERTLKLTVQERLPTDSKGWDTADNIGKTYDLTIIDKGKRIEILELSETFVRCEANEPRSIGLHRW